MKLLLLLVSLAFAAVSSAQQTFVSEFEVAGFSCELCSTAATDALRKLPGVTKVDVTLATKKARVESKRAISEAELRATMKKLGFDTRFPHEPVVAPLTDAEKARLDIKVASRGEAFDVRKHLARGKYTIFDFWAAWCGPCHVLTPKLERLVAENANIALRTIDLQNWESAAAKQATKDFKLPGLPYVRIYGPDGKFVGEVVGNDIEAIQRIIAGRR